MCCDISSTRSLDNYDQVVEWARQGGQIALRHFRDVTCQTKPDQSFLTQVDVEIERFLAERIGGAYPDHSLVGEEDTRIRSERSAHDVWVIDPLDGTTAFVQGLPGWGISIGLLQKGQPCFGLFYMPLSDDMTYTDAHSVVSTSAHIEHRAVRTDWGQKGFLAVGASAHHDFRIDVRRTRTLGSVGASLVYTTRGTASAAFIPKAYLWDLVPGAAILSRAGGELRYLSGRNIDYLELLNGQLAPEPIIAGHRHLLAELPGRVRRRLHSGF